MATEVEKSPLDALKAQAAEYKALYQAVESQNQRDKKTIGELQQKADKAAELEAQIASLNKVMDGKDAQIAGLTTTVSAFQAKQAKADAVLAGVRAFKSVFDGC